MRTFMGPSAVSTWNGIQLELVVQNFEHKTLKKQAMMDREFKVGNNQIQKANRL